MLTNGTTDVKELITTMVEVHHVGWITLATVHTRNSFSFPDDLYPYIRALSSCARASSIPISLVCTYLVFMSLTVSLLGIKYLLRIPLLPAFESFVFSH